MKRKTSIIILTYNHLDYTKECLRSIYKYTKNGTYEIIIVDNNSTDGTRDFLKQQKNIKLILNDKNVGFPKGCNQGINISNKKNDILLLNNDTIVTKNWLENLKKCLYSKSNIGAVGSVCNHDENLQGSNIKYKDFDEMQNLAQQNNISDSNRWEEKIFLIGFCLLIRRKVIDKIKILDENYTPGYVEDNDFSLQISQLGYRLILCHDSFIHHYLGSSFRSDLDKFYSTLNKNREYFKSKWGFHPFAFDDIKMKSLSLLENPRKILEFDCGIGVTILKIKYLFPNIIIDGVEKDLSKKSISKKITNVFSSVDEIKDNDYDYIMIGNLLEQILNPEEFLSKIKNYLKDDGYIIGEIHNVSKIHNVMKLISDNWYFENKGNLFTISDIYKLFLNQNYKNPLLYSWSSKLTEEEQKIFDKIGNENLKNSYYSFRFQK